MRIDEAMDRGVFKVSVDVSEHFGQKEGEVVLRFREPSLSESVRFREANDGDEQGRKVMSEVLMACLIDHPFTKPDDDSKKASKEEVLKVLEASTSLYLLVARGWQESLPLQKKTTGS